MRLFVLIAIASYLHACSFGSGGSHNSQWLKLDEASNVSCEPWPLGERDLSVSDIFTVTHNPQGFLVKGLQRNAQPLLYYLPFKGDTDVSKQDARLLRVPRSAQVLGLIKDRNKELLVIYSVEKGKGYLEVRDPMTNVIISKTAIGSDEEKIGYTVHRNLRSFVVLEDDAGVYSVYEARSEKGKIQFKSLSLPKIDARPQIQMSNVGHAYIAWLEGKTVKANILNANGSMSRTLNVWTAPDDVEGWSLAVNNAYLSVNAVVGNSLVGNASLYSIQFNEYQGSIKVLKTSTQKIIDTHVGELFQLQYRDDDEQKDRLLIQQWVDDESTVALYDVSVNGISQPKYRGVFDKKLRVYHAFEDKGDLYVVMRQRKYDLWDYSICELGD